jgi:hypothetical protein
VSLCRLYDCHFAVVSDWFSTRWDALCQNPFSEFANWSSILGLLFSIIGLIVSICVWRVTRDFRQRIAIQRFRSKLCATVKTLKPCQAAKNVEAVRTTLSACRYDMIDYVNYLGSRRKKDVKLVIRHVQEYLSLSPDDQWTQCGKIIAEIHGVCETVKNLDDEMKRGG